MADAFPTVQFPADAAIPAAHRIGSPIDQREYLCDGEIREWTGPRQDVLSPICEPADGQKVIGLKAGMPWDADVQITPLPEPNKTAWLTALIDDARAKGARVNINCQCQRGPDAFPFTGRKDSAEGTLSVSDALRVFTIRTLVATKATDANKRLIKSIVTERKSKFLSTDFLL